MKRLLLCFFVSSLTMFAHELAYPDKEIQFVAGIILDGEIIQSDLTSTQEIVSRDGAIYEYVNFRYQFKIEKVIRGKQYYQEGDVMKMVQDFNVLKGSPVNFYQKGDKFRFVENFGKTKDGVFQPYSSHANKAYGKKDSLFGVSDNTARPHLYGRPLDWEGVVQHNHDRPHKPLQNSENEQKLKNQNRVPKPLAETRSFEENKPNSFPWWLLGVVALIAFAGHVLVKGRSK